MNASPTNHPQPAGTAAINEIDCCVIKLPASGGPAWRGQDLSYLPLIREGSSGGWQPLSTGIHWQAAYEVIGRICNDRAWKAVGGGLIVKHRAITPSAYIRRWRAAITAAIDLHQFEQLHHQRVWACFEFEDADLERAKSSWNNPPYACFADLLRAHQAQHRAINGHHVLVINIGCENGARDAWWASQYLDTTSPRPDMARGWLQIDPLPRNPEPNEPIALTSHNSPVLVTA